MPDYTAIQSIRNFKGLIRYLRTELDWPVDEDQAVDLTFDYEPDELGLDEKHKVKIRAVKQIRPLVDGQPWGIFWIDFEPKRLPIVVMRRILGALAASQRRARRAVKQARWDVRDLMFISATGQGSERGVSFAHFRETEDGQPQLRTFSWDVRETHLYYIKNLNLAALRWPVDSANAGAWRATWAAAFTAGHREVIRTSEALAGRMAQLADVTRHAVNEAFVYEKPTGPLHKLYESFKKVLIHRPEAGDSHLRHYTTMQPQELYFRGSMAQFWNVIYAEYQRLHAALGCEPFEFTSPLGLLGGRISEYVPKETDKISITFFDHGHGLDVISLEVEFSRIQEMVCLTVADSDDFDFVPYEGYGKSALSMWNEVRSALEKSGRLVDLHAQILDNRPHLLAKPEKPPKPEHRSNINAWFDWYHGMLEAGFHCTLAEIAEETHHSPGYIRRQHANYKKERG